MKTADFFFDLPEGLIAQYPPVQRGQSRLMVMDRKKGCLDHRMVNDLPAILEKGTLMVFNNSRVRRARLFGISEASGAKAEFLLLKKIDPFSWLVLSKRSKRQKPGNRYAFDDVSAELQIAAEGDLLLCFDRQIDDAWLDVHGHIPLPPYIRRNDSDDDAERYQTVYAKEYGSAAAPTAGLHFTEELLSELENAGMETVFITLHVGLGTFLPVRAENLEEHKMHEEAYGIDEGAACRIEKAKAEGRKVLAVGTTSLRALESAWMEGRPLPGNGRLKRGEGSTSIFIYPGYAFKAADCLFTNFHTPASTLLMLVSAFAEGNLAPNGCRLAGRDFILEGYKEAIKKGYRFFSYGDACLIL
jgi:S-adenosylmethionine:tRNA ribosyltransferase-isomerase